MEENLHGAENEVEVTFETDAVFLDDDLDELTEPRVRGAAAVEAHEVGDCAEGGFNVPLAHALRSLFQEGSEDAADDVWVGGFFQERRGQFAVQHAQTEAFFCLQEEIGRSYYRLVFLTHSLCFFFFF